MKRILFYDRISLLKKCRYGKSFLLFTIFKRYLLENGVGSDHIVEIALDGIENEELRDPKLRFWFPRQAVTTLREGFAWKEITGRY